MHHVLPGAEIDLAVGVLDAFDDAGAVVVEDLLGAHLDHHGGQALERAEHRGDVGLGGIHAGGVGHDHPAQGIAAREHGVAVGPVGYGVAGEGQVGPRRDGGGAGGLVQALVAELHAQRDRQAPARGVTGDGGVGRLSPVGQVPLPCRQGIIQGSRVGVLGSETVVHVQHPGLGPDRHTAHHMAVGVQAAHHIAAAMEVQDDPIALNLRRRHPLGGNPTGVDRLETHPVGDGHRAVPLLEPGPSGGQIRRRTSGGILHLLLECSDCGVVSV